MLLEWIGSLLVAQYLFFPQKGIQFNPAQFQMPYEEVRLRNDDGQRLHGWFFPGTKAQTLLYLHGNAGNISNRLDKIQFLRQIGWSLFIFDYRGYGDSEGSPSIEGVLKDSEAALRYLVRSRQIPTEQIILFGESLGGALATDLASREPFGGVILESNFTSLRDMAQSAYPFVPDLIVPDVYRSIEFIRQIKAPLLIIHGAQDHIIPVEMGKRLFKSAPHPKRFYSVPQASHNDVYVVGQREYLRQIEEFLDGME